ncbi:MAG: hypothetical protein HC930_17210 [Hydrococcus sp. SU_1_0]|nr:hypothetical protein [Hydrococcus sp. SU_1_0]
MSSVVLDFGTSSISGDNLEYLGQQGEANIIEVKPDGEESGSSITIIGGSKNDQINLGVAGGSTALGLDGDDQLKGGHGND